MDQVLHLLLLIEDFIDTEEKTLFDWDVLACHSIVLEEVANDLDQPLLNLD